MAGLLRLKKSLAGLLAVTLVSFLCITPAGSQSTTSPTGSRKIPGRELADLVRAGDQFGSFKKASGPTYYFPDTLFDYINGGAELFLAYGFVDLLVAEFTEDGNPVHRATLEIYNMGALENAFGVFKAEQGGDPYKLPGGAEGSLGYGMMQFYKGIFYVKAFLPPASKAYPDLIKQIGATVESRIRGTFTRPAFFDLLPVKDRVPDSENYTSRDFLGQPYFNRIASAQYTGEGKTYKIFLSVEPDKNAAASLKKYRKYLIDEKAYQGELGRGMPGFTGQDPYYGHCAIAIIKERIAGVLGNHENAASILESMGGRIDEKK